jgi:hypothetical protein
VEKVLVDEVASVPAGTHAAELPERVAEALGELAGAAKEGLLALSVGVLHELRRRRSMRLWGRRVVTTAIAPPCVTAMRVAR